MKQVIGDATLYLGDCLDILPTLGKVDAVVTSPPYMNQRDYGADIPDWRSLVGGGLRKVNDSESCQMLINLGLIHREGRVVRYWDDMIEDMENNGWRLFGWYIWDKGDGLPGNWNGRLAPSHEFIFHFNRTAIQPNKWVKSKGTWNLGTGLRNKDGSMSGITSPDKFNQGHKIQDSVIRLYARNAERIEHPATFPVHLPTELLMSYSAESSVVLDPFMGSGTTGVACMNLKRKFIGIEIEPKYFDIACERIENAQRQQNLF